MKLDMKDIAEKMKTMQEAMAARQKELASKTFRAGAGGGMVTATVSGGLKLLRIELDHSIISTENAGMIEGLVVSAVNEAYKQANDAIRDDLSGMMGLGGLANLLGKLG